MFADDGCMVGVDVDVDVDVDVGAAGVEVVVPDMAAEKGALCIAPGNELDVAVVTLPKGGRLRSCCRASVVLSCDWWEGSSACTDVAGTVAAVVVRSNGADPWSAGGNTKEEGDGA